MQSKAKILIIKLVVFGLFIGLVQLVLYPIELKGSFRRKLQLDKHLQQKADIIFFGDSTIHATHPDDKDKSSIAAMLQQELSQHTVGGVSRYSFHLDLFAYFADYLIRQQHKPGWAIFVINLRSFSPEFDLQPTWQFEKKKLILAYGHNPLFRMAYKGLLTFKAFDMGSVTLSQYMHAPIYRGDKQIGIQRDFSNQSYLQPTVQRLRNKIILRYMFHLQSDHRKVQSLLHIADVLSQYKIKPIFYITPIDYHVGAREFGQEFMQIVQSNTRLLSDQLQQHDIALLDLSLALPERDFNWDNYPNEHMKEAGRRFVAQSIAAHIP